MEDYDNLPDYTTNKWKYTILHISYLSLYEIYMICATEVILD